MWQVNDLYKEQFAAWAQAFPHVRLLSDGTLTNETRLGAVACIRLACDAFSLRATDLLVIGGDTLYLADFSLCAVVAGFEAKRAALEGPSSLCFAYPCDDAGTTKHGIIEVAPAGVVTAFLEKPGPLATASRLASPCSYIFSPAALVSAVDAIFVDGN